MNLLLGEAASDFQSLLVSFMNETCLRRLTTRLSVPFHSLLVSFMNETEVEPGDRVISQLAR